jgi:archaellum component FlaC
VDQDLIVYLERRFEDTVRRLDGLRQDIGDRLGRVDRRSGQEEQRVEELEEELRRLESTLEDLGTEIRAVGRAVATVDDKLERFRGYVERELEELRSLTWIVRRAGASEPRL